jgi:hypothetical protein
LYSHWPLRVDAISRFIEILERLNSMRLPRPKLTIRVMMVLVAIVAVALSGEMMRRRRATWLSHAKHHGFLEDVSGWNLALARKYTDQHSAKHPGEKGTDGYIKNPEIRALISPNNLERQRRTLQFHKLMRIKYEHAARYPWLIVEPDPRKPN